MKYVLEQKGFVANVLNLWARFKLRRGVGLKKNCNVFTINLLTDKNV